MVAINARCLDDIELSSIEIGHLDGAASDSSMSGKTMLTSAGGCRLILVTVHPWS